MDLQRHVRYAASAEASDGFAACSVDSDHERRGLSLERLEKAARRAQRRMLVFYSALIAVIVWFLFFYQSKFDVQPNNLAYLPIVLLQIFNPVFLVFIIAQIFIFRKNGRDLRLLKSSCKALKEGLAPPPSAGPSKKIVWENVMSLVAIIPIAILILWQYSAPYSNILLDDFNRPYIEIQAMERTPVYQWDDLFEDPPFRNSQGTYYADVEYSLLAPSWYSVTQEAYSPQNGTRGNVFSKDSENGANRYSPELEMTFFHLLIPPMAQSVAEEQMEQYRLVNVRWSYEYVDYSDLDSVIIANEPNGI